MKINLQTMFFESKVNICQNKIILLKCMMHIAIYM